MSPADRRQHHPLRAARVALAVALASFVLAGLGASAAAATDFGPSFDCPPAVVTFQTLATLAEQVGPLAARTNTVVSDAGADCLGSADVTFVAFRRAPVGIGGSTRYAVTPRWLATWQTLMFLARDDRSTDDGFSGQYLAVAVPPDLQAAFDRVDGDWVSVSGHFDDPRAADCHFTTPPVSGSGAPSAADLRGMCATSFVLTRIESTPSPCPVSAIDWFAISATPEHLRARCFGSDPVTFTARGFSIANRWPGLDEFVANDWELLDPAKVGDLATDRDRALQVFVSDTVTLPDPAGTPWSNSDGVGGPEVLWRVTGHFDDQGSVRCRPSKGTSVDGRLVGWSLDDARRFCRNHLVVDTLVWIPDAPAPSPSPDSAPTPSETTTVTNEPSAAQPSATPSSSPSTSGDSPIGPAGLLAGVVVAGGLATRLVLARRRRRP